MADEGNLAVFFLVGFGIPIALMLVAHLVFGSRWRVEDKEAARAAWKHPWQDYLWFKMRRSGLPESRIRTPDNPLYGHEPDRTLFDAKLKALPVDPSTSFDPATLELLQQRCLAEGLVGEEIHRIYRSPSGTYFLVIGNDSGPEPLYVTPISRERAMNAFRDDPDAFRKAFGDGGPWPFRRLLARKTQLGVQRRVPPAR